MKTIITLIFAISTITTSFAESKDELIEKLIVLNDTEAQFKASAERILTELAKYNSDNSSSNSTYNIVRTHCSWESWKPYYVQILKNGYTPEELKILVEYSSSLPPEILKLTEKRVDIEVQSFFAKQEWQKSVMKKIDDAIKSKPKKKTVYTNAEAWASWSNTKKWMYIDGFKAGSSTALNIVQKRSEGDLKKEVDDVRNKIKLPTYTVDLERAVTELYEVPGNKHILSEDMLLLAEHKLQGHDISSQLTEARTRGLESFKRKFPNQRVDLTVKTPVESGNVQGTAGHP